MSKFIFIRTATDFASFDAQELMTATYVSSGAVLLTFRTYKDGEETTAGVELAVTAGYEKEAAKDISSQAGSSRGDMLYSNISLGPKEKVKTGSSPEQQPSFASTYVTAVTSITFAATAASSGLPAGGEAGQYLVKDSDTDYDASWSNVTTIYTTVRNTSGGALDKGTPVHAVGVTGEVADVIAARADTASAMPATYVLNEDLANNASGQAIIVGEITGVDTSSFAAGDKVYVGSTGGFTNVKPTGTDLIQNLGVVTKSNANTGSGVVLGAGRSNDVPNIPENYIWIGNASGVATPTAISSAVDTHVGPWVTTAGRLQFDTADVNQTIACGSAYGPVGYYLWFQAMFTTVSSGTIDTTTQVLSSVYQNYGGLRMPSTKKVSVDMMIRNANSTTYSKDMRLQIWSFALESSSSTVTMTLRADQTFTTPGNTYPANVTATTTSAISEDEYIFVFVAADNITLSGTGYIYATMQLELTE
jgi:hypothetical protein